MKALWTIAAAILVMGAMPVWAQAATDSSPSQPSGSRPSSRNEELERKILANLLADHDLKNNRIDVTVEGTTVTLKGKVDSDAERSTASRLAQVEGIAIVHDQLEVGSQGVKEVVTDTAVTTELKAQFLADTTLRHATISVATNNGVVTLQGVVPTRAARAKAVALATRLKGVSRVEDDLQLPPKDVAP